MFTGNTVALAEFDGEFSLEVVRDCRLAYVAKVPSTLAGRVVPCAKAQHVKDAVAREGIVGIITVPELADQVPERLGLALSAAPQASAWALHARLASTVGFHWHDFESRIDPSADVRAGASVVARNVVIGARTVVMPGAVICERSIIGSDCLIGPGSVIGCAGFDIDTTRSPRRLHTAAGGVLFEDHVEIIGLASVARATFGGFTRLGEETKVDCHVYIAHDCEIGRRVSIAASAELSGRVQVGDDVFIGPNCSISNGLKLGDGAVVTLGAVVVRNVGAGEKVSGHFARQHGKWLQVEYLRGRHA